ncbi:MAG: M56 family metallopeptidase [Hymenobacter sp.]
MSLFVETSMIEKLIVEPMLHSVGQALVHSVWQGALIALLLASFNRVYQQRISASLRYTAACGALLLMLLLPIVTVSFLTASSTTNESHDRSQVAQLKEASANAGGLAVADTALGQPLLTDEELSTANQLIPFPAKASARLHVLLPWLALLWFVGVLTLAVRLLGGWTRARRLRTRGTSAVVILWQNKFQQLTAQLGVSRPIRLCQSLAVEVPTVIGWLRPVVLVPVSAFTTLSASQLEVSSTTGLRF